MRRPLASLLVVLLAPVQAASLQLADDRLSLIFDDGQQQVLVASCVACREPVLSADGQSVAWIASDAQGHEGIWLQQLVASSARLLLQAQAAEESEQNLTDFSGLTFSADGRQLYFMSAAWVTSSAVHRLDLQTGEQRYLVAGNDLQVLTDGQLAVQQHRYLAGGGSHEVWWLVSPQGQELRELGEDWQPAAQAD